MQKTITEEMLSELRQNVAKGLSERRYNHTLEVEKMVARLAEMYCPEKVLELRAAALLHDITKEYSDKVHISMLSKPGIEFTQEERLAPKTFHARTAVLLIPEIYPEFADDDVIAAIRWHTTGRGGMTTPEKLLYLADYIDMSRTFEDCVKLREFFFSKDIDGMTEEDKNLVTGLFGDKDPVVHFRPLMARLYGEERCLWFNGEHRLNDTVVKSVLVPLINDMLVQNY